MLDPHQPAAPTRVDAETDVLVIGGGLAGTWAALTAAERGISVTLVDKGYCGTSGVTATAGVGHWWVPPTDDAREVAVAGRLDTAVGLGERDWMHAIIDTTWTQLHTRAADLPLHLATDGTPAARLIRGPEYMRAMRRLVRRAGVRVLDHHPATELLARTDGSIGGARGIRRQEGGTWQIRAGAVILAAGGCGFASRLLGALGNTGDGTLMAAEAGAALSGMEFSSFYTLSPAHSTMTRAMAYLFGTYLDCDGNEIATSTPQTFQINIARAMLRGPVHARLDKMPDHIRATMPQVQPNFMLPFDRVGIDPYRDFFPVALRYEGTIRGVGGVRVTDLDGSCGVEGLYVIGDNASRESVAGATSGGGAQNSAWALTSGNRAAASAVAHAQQIRSRTETLEPLGTAGLRAGGRVRDVDLRASVDAVKAHTHPLDVSMFRTPDRLHEARAVLDAVWREVRFGVDGSGATDHERLRRREVAALVANARWITSSALARNESRGMHMRTDAPATDPRYGHRLVVRGIDRIRVSAADQSAGPEGAS